MLVRSEGDIEVFAEGAVKKLKNQFKYKVPLHAGFEFKRLCFKALFFDFETYLG